MPSPSHKARACASTSDTVRTPRSSPTAARNVIRSAACRAQSASPSHRTCRGARPQGNPSSMHEAGQGKGAACPPRCRIIAITRRRARPLACRTPRESTGRTSSKGVPPCSPARQSVAGPHNVSAHNHARRRRGSRQTIQARCAIPAVDAGSERSGVGMVAIGTVSETLRRRISGSTTSVKSPDPQGKAPEARPASERPYPIGCVGHRRPWVFRKTAPP